MIKLDKTAIQQNDFLKIVYHGYNLQEFDLNI